MRLFIRSLLALPLAVCGLTPAFSQLPDRWTSPSPVAGIERGTQILSLPDVNADGFPDVLVASRTGYQSPDSPGTGIVELLDGATGQILGTLTTPETDDGFGAAIANMGDINGDGVIDIAVGAPGAPGGGAVYVYSGGSGGLMYIASSPNGTSNFGSSLDTIDDVTGDAIRELVVGGPEFFTEGGSRVHLFSGGDGSQLTTWAAPDVQRTGVQLASLGDVTGDGIPDLVIAAEGDTTFGPGAFAYVINGHTGGILYFLPVTQNNASYKARVDALGDLDGDGHSEFVLGTETSLSAFNITSRLKVYSGATGQLLADHFLANSPLKDVAAGDLDGDGYREYLASTASGPFIFGGRSLREQAAFRDVWLSSNETNGIAVIGDISGDLLGEFAFGMGSEVISNCMTGIRLAHPGGGALDPLELDWNFANLDAGLHGTISSTNAVPNGQGVLLVSFAPQTLTFMGAPIYVGPSPVLALSIPFDATGSVHVHFSLAQPTLEGVTLFLQTAQATGAGLTTSNLMEILYSPGRFDIEDVSPVHAQVGDTVTLSGFGFDRVDDVRIGGIPVTPSVHTFDTIVFQVPAATSCGDRTEIRLSNALGERNIDFLNPAVALDNVVNASGPAAGGATMLLIGGPFDDSVEVLIGGQSSTVNVLSETILQVIAPAGVVGSASVEVNFGSGCQLLTTYQYL